MTKIQRLTARLDRIGISVEFQANLPWIYLNKVNGTRVTEKYLGNHGFTAAFLSAKGKDNVVFPNLRRLFQEIRKHLDS
jgi:hypothetical protein